MKYYVSVKLKNDFIEVSGNAMRVGVMARPEKEKANEEMLKKIAEYFCVPRSRVKIIAGVRSRKKIIEVI